jgi:sporulation protein YlmC with PRC-barrel domain
MRKLPIVVALFSTLSIASVYAQDTMTPASPAPAPAAQAAPAAGESAAAATQTTTQADLTGQTIYDAKGTKIGIVSSVSTDTQGQQQAVVGVERFLGMGGKNVMFPVSSLKSRTAGGYTTSLTPAEIKGLPEAAAATH